MSSDSNPLRPDMTLLLDLQGVIREAHFSEAMPRQDDAAWVGRSWTDTVEEVAAAKVRRLIDDASTSGVSAFRQVNQRLAGGAECLMEFTAVRLGNTSTLVAVGKNLQAVAQLQSKLIEAQQAMERDYWKLRQVETRYQRLFHSSTEAVMVLSHPDLRILELNPAAASILDPSGERHGQLPGRSVLDEIENQDRGVLQQMLARTLEHGAAPGVLIHAGADRTPWLVHASPSSTEQGQGFLVQLLAAGGPRRPAEPRQADYSVGAMLAGGPDALAVIDTDGMIQEVNRAFLDLAQIDSAGAVLGKRISQWLGRPGADSTVLLANAVRHGAVRLFHTTIHGALGAETEVEISAAVDDEVAPQYLSLLIRDIGRRLLAAESTGETGAMLAALNQDIGRKTLKALVQEAVTVVEKHYLASALELTEGNRTAAAELLGLSRQSLYSKLARYGLDRASGNGTPELNA